MAEEQQESSQGELEGKRNRYSTGYPTVCPGSFWKEAPQVGGAAARCLARCPGDTQRGDTDTQTEATACRLVSELTLTALHKEENARLARE